MPDLPLSFTGVGGPILAVLLVLSFVSVTIIVFKSVELWRARRGSRSRETATAALRDGDMAAARRGFEAGRAPADAIALAGLARLGRADPVAAIEKSLVLDGNAAVSRLFRYIRVLELVAMISPLLGLLGTVLGMIQSFRELELAEGAANAALLAGGIWQALLTTAAGLVVAIPAAAAAALLAGRAEASARDVEQVIGAVLVRAETEKAAA
jgi:biopolymer transport protein ExbB